MLLSAGFAELPALLEPQRIRLAAGDNKPSGINRLRKGAPEPGKHHKTAHGKKECVY